MLSKKRLGLFWLKLPAEPAKMIEPVDKEGKVIPDKAVRVPLMLVSPLTFKAKAPGAEVLIPTFPSTIKPLLGGDRVAYEMPIPTLPATPKVREVGAVEVPIPTLPETAREEDKVLAPETASVPDNEMESFKERVVDPPSDTSPPPDKLVPGETVILELDKAELAILFKVLSEPEIVLLVNVWVVSVPTIVVVASGMVIVLAAVGVQVNVPVDPAALTIS